MSENKTMAVRLELVVNCDPADKSLDKLVDRLNGALNEWGDEHDAKRRLYVREEGIKFKPLDDMEDGLTMAANIFDIEMSAGLMKKMDSYVGGTFESRSELIDHAVRHFLEQKRADDALDHIELMNIKASGLDLTDDAEEMREPYVRLSIATSKVMNKKDQARCESIYSKALDEIKTEITGKRPSNVKATGS
ncbi:MAG: hypothetical protein LUQ09_07685 [Methanomassiliicoccales archaeon]|nr:hypothetical protein [Methanomassiliicoccales archaeon]